MKCLQQLLRQPLKFISGVIVVSLAVSILCVCLGQAVVAAKTQEKMEYHFTTIALPTTKYNYKDIEAVDSEGNIVQLTSVATQTMPEEITKWIESLEDAYPNLVTTLARPGLASAYLADVIPDNPTNHMYHYPLIGSTESRFPHNMEGISPSATAMFEIVLDQIGEVEEISFPRKMEDGTEIRITTRVSVELIGTIRSVVSLEEGYDDPTGRTVYYTLTLPNQETLTALNFQTGQRYLICGNNYLDGEWALCGYLSENISDRLGQTVVIDKFNENNLVGDRYAYNNISVPLPERILKWHNSVSLSARDASIFPVTEYIKYSDGSGYYPLQHWDRYITDENGNQIQITQEEYSALYSVPTIVHLTGTVEEFLKSEEGALWERKLAHMQVNYQAFAVLGVDKLGYIADFARETARIVEGRDFTAEELESGAKVCIISESLAAANGLKVGDSIYPRFYNYDFNDPYQGFLAEGVGIVNPAAYRFTANTEWAGEQEEYIIVGLYRQDNAWCDVSDNPYSFTPNTIFAPKSSIFSDMDYGTQGMFQILVLQNGAIEEFRAVVEETGYPDLFVFYDQEYTTISDSLENYREVAQRAMMIGFVVYGVVLVLFLLFFPGSQGKALSTMKALGTPSRYKMAHVFMNSASILIPGTVIGAALGMLLWQKVIDAIAESVGAAVTLGMDAMSLVLIALAQMVLAFLLTALIAIPMSRNHGLAKRK